MAVKQVDRNLTGNSARNKPESSLFDDKVAVKQVDRHLTGNSARNKPESS